MAESHVLIIGGGLAGLSTAVALVNHGCQVTLLEARPRLGGRASSVVDATTGETIDNCQHVSMGCCVNFEQLCQQTDTADLCCREEELYFIGPGRADGHANTSSPRVNVFRNGPGPAPLHLAGSFARLDYLTWAEKFSLGKAVRQLFRAQPPASGKFSDWLDQQQQTRRLQERFWNIVLVSALSERLDRIDFSHARKVFLEGFLQHRNAWHVQLMTVPLAEFYDEHLATWLRGRGATVRCKAGVQELQVADIDGELRVQGVKLRDGSQLSADHYVVAVPWDRVTGLLPETLQQQTCWSQLNQLESAAITSVHLWTDRPITQLRHAVLIDRTSQWMFNRSAILERQSEDATQESSPTARYAYQVVISNSRDEELQRMSQQELIEAVWQEVQEIWPDARQATRLHARAITEHKAVFSPLPGVESLRPSQQTAIDNLLLAGDFTQTGWPATMEGAVRSGYLAAGQILRKEGKVATVDSLLAPELKPSWLMKCLADVNRQI